MTRPAPQSDTLLVFVTQDYLNKFTITVVADAFNSGTGGSLSLSIEGLNLGTGATILVQDDPQNSISDTGDSWYFVNGQGTFTLTWGSTTTDGFVLGKI